MPLLFDPARDPALGRLLGLGMRYRLRDADEGLDALPGDLRFDVLDEAGLQEPLVTNREALLVATEAGKAILEGAGLDVACTAKAGDQTLFVFRPDEEVPPDTEDEADEDTSYGRIFRAASLSVDNLAYPVAVVTQTRLFAFDDDTAAALTDAGLTRGVRAPEAAYGPEPESPWYIVTAERVSRCAQFGKGVVLEGGGPMPDQNPLAAFIRVDDQLNEGDDAFWLRNLDDNKTLRQLYASGAPLPAVTLTQDPPKASKKILDLAYTGFLILSPAAIAAVDALGIEGDRAPVTFLDTTGKPMKQSEHALFRASPRALIDWRQSDVNWTRSHTIWGFRELELSAAADADDVPALVHIPGTRLHLAHQRFVDAVDEAGLQGFEMVPVSWYSYAVNLDDELTDWLL